MKRIYIRVILVLIAMVATGCKSTDQPNTSSAVEGAKSSEGGGTEKSTSNAGSSNVSNTEKSANDAQSGNSCSKKNHGSPDFSCDCSHVDVDLPFNYTINAGQLLLKTEGGPLHAVISPWGAHTEPFTGHFGGNHKSDWGAFYASSYAEMTELTPSNRNGICEKGETCGVHRSKIEAKQPKYIVPTNRFMITAVYASKTKVYKNEFEGRMSYQVYGWVCNYRYTFPYMKEIGANLRAKMIAAGYEDPHSITEDRFGNPNSLSFNPDNLIKGAPIVLDKGDEIGLIQVRAEAVQNHADYFKGRYGPWAALEFTLDNLTLTDGYNTGIYPVLPKGLQESLLEVFNTEGKKGENSLKFGQMFSTKWLWGAEMVLNASKPTLHQDYSSLFSWLGGWVERPANPNCQGRREKACDENFSIFSVHKESPFYDPKLYDSADTSYLINRGFGAGVESGEVISPSQLDPTGGTMIIKWRTGSTRYQKVSYRVEPHNKQLKVRWGVVKATLDELRDIAIPQESEVCDGESLTCFDHEARF